MNTIDKNMVYHVYPEARVTGDLRGLLLSELDADGSVYESHRGRGYAGPTVDYIRIWMKFDTNIGVHVVPVFIYFQEMEGFNVKLSYRNLRDDVLTRKVAQSN